MDLTVPFLNFLYPALSKTESLMGPYLPTDLP
jgi:hypothetical protein